MNSNKITISMQILVISFGGSLYRLSFTHDSVHVGNLSRHCYTW